MRGILAMILAGGRGSRLNVLSKKRVKPALPFAGKYRIIDFALSNCVNSGIFNIGIPTQYQPHSLNDHVRTGEPWDLDRRFSGGLTLLPPCQRDGGSLDWYRGTADAVYQNLDFVARHNPETVLVLPGDHVYKMDYCLLIHYHRQHQADLTICTTQVPLENAPQFGIVVTEKDGRVVSFQEKPPRPSGALASMGIYVFQADVLMQRLAQDARLLNSSHDFGQDIIPRMLELGDRIYAYSFEDYWMDVGTIQAYWQANMDLLSPRPRLNLSDPRWGIYTRSEERPPVHICPSAAVSNSLISEGCVIEGRVEGSVLSPGVHVRTGAVVRDSIVFSDCEIGSGGRVQRAILDKNVVVGQGACIGFEPDYERGHRSAETNHSLTLVGKNTHLPAGICVGCDCVIENDLAESDFVTDLFQWSWKSCFCVAEPREAIG
jgi:glucose-1-phosphate adenylyltransferase